MARSRIALAVLVTITLLAFGTITAPIGTFRAPIAFADGDNDEGGNYDGQDRDDKEDKEDKNDEDEGKKDNENDKNGGKKGDGGDHGGAFTPADPYRVDVDCAYDSAADETTCTFTGVAPEGAKDVSHVDLPAAEVCAEVIGGEHEYVDPDPNTRVVGYKSRGGEGIFSLILTGEVTPGGTATYWFKTGDGVFPATGPGLVCDAAASQDHAEATGDTGAAVATATAPAAAATGTAPAGDVTTGAIIVQIYGCAEKPATAEFDWYGRCEPGVEGVLLTLSLQNESGYASAGKGTTTVNGEFHFKGLAPGTYRLETPDATWCHAEVDRVDAQGNLIVEAGAEVTVWIFFCGAAVVK